MFSIAVFHSQKGILQQEDIEVIAEVLGDRIKYIKQVELELDGDDLSDMIGILTLLFVVLLLNCSCAALCCDCCCQLVNMLILLHFLIYRRMCKCVHKLKHDQCVHCKQ